MISAAESMILAVAKYQATVLTIFSFIYQMKDYFTQDFDLNCINLASLIDISSF